MGPNGIGIDPQTIHSVASQCRNIKSNLDEQVGNFTQQLNQMEGSLQGAAADTFKAQFVKWQNLVRQMSETLDTTSQTLDKIASAADEQIAALQSLGQG